MNQSYQDAMCGALVTAMCYMKARQTPSPATSRRPVLHALPVQHNYKIPDCCVILVQFSFLLFY